MEGIASVRRADEDRILWRGFLDGREVSLDEPDLGLGAGEADRMTSGSGHRDAGGEVTFAEAEPSRTRIHVRIDWPSENEVELNLERLRRIVEADPRR